MFIFLLLIVTIIYGVDFHHISVTHGRRGTITWTVLWLGICVEILVFNFA